MNSIRYQEAIIAPSGGRDDEIRGEDLTEGCENCVMSSSTFLFSLNNIKIKNSGKLRWKRRAARIGMIRNAPKGFYSGGRTWPRHMRDSPACRNAKQCIGQRARVNFGTKKS
jgi:hypothetical protein